MARQYFKPGNMLYPVPAVMVSCGREGETPNIITVAWAGTVCSSPAMLSISVRPERYSHAILMETKEFVVNLVTKDLVFAADYCGVKSGRDVDKYKEMAEVVGGSVNENFMDENGKFLLNSTGLVAYSHGEYFELGKKLGSFGYSVKKTGNGKKSGSAEKTNIGSKRDNQKHASVKGTGAKRSGGNRRKSK